MLRQLLENCTPSDARIIMECLAVLHPDQTSGLNPAGERQVEIIFLIEKGFNTSPLIQRETGLTGSNVCTQLKSLERHGYITADRTYRKGTKYRRVNVDDLLSESSDE